MKLGRIQSPPDPRDLRLSPFVERSKVVLPPATNWNAKSGTPGMYLNDRYGSCTCASLGGHALETWTGNAATRETPTDEQIKRAYFSVSGGVDRGANMRTVLNHCRKHGIGYHRIAAFATVENDSIEEIEQSIYLFGGCYAGISMPNDWQQSDWQKPTRKPNPQNGHAIWLRDYDRAKRQFTVPTWGEIRHASYDWILAYLEESYAVISPNWLAGKATAPNGVNLPELFVELGKIAQ